jgi:hypothetical protein
MGNQRTQYHLLHTEKSFCIGCHKELDLLTSDALYKPTFFICWTCNRVFQAGVGEIEKEKTNAI